jgi:ABC-type glycerol-3-phosphate transport system substrate-binding protein
MMNKRVWLSVIAACVVVGTIAAAQVVGRSSSSSSHSSSKQSHRVVFDVSMEGAERWDGVLNNVENLRRAFGERNTEVEVVVHGKALPLLQRTNTAMSERMRDLSERA